jgi:hypothetical protein
MSSIHGFPTSLRMAHKATIQVSKPLMASAVLSRETGRSSTPLFDTR